MVFWQLYLELSIVTSRYFYDALITSYFVLAWKNFLSLVSLSKIPLSRDFVSTYILVLSVALRTSLYGALKEFMSPAVLTIIIVMYYRLWWAGLFIQPYSVRRHTVYIGWRTYTFSFEFLSLQVEVVSCHSWLHPYWYVCRCRCTRNVRSMSL